LVFRVSDEFCKSEWEISNIADDAGFNQPHLKKAQTEGLASHSAEGHTQQ